VKRGKKKNVENMKEKRQTERTEIEKIGVKRVK
jgi:hypothetical protein